MTSSLRAPGYVRPRAPHRDRGGMSRRLRALLGSARQKPNSGPRVLVAGKLTALLAPGGGEVQMLRTVDALQQQGLAARLWRPWEDHWDEVDVLHLFGSERQHLELARYARRRGIRVVLSPIAWFNAQDCLREPRPLGERLVDWTKFQVRSYWPGCPSWRRRLYHAVDHLLPNSHAEAEQLQRLFEIREERLVVVPNAADERFAHGDPAAFIERFDIRDFVLYAGRLEPRKNQLTFLRAMHGSGVPIVVLGDVVPGHEKYADECRRAADEQVQFIARIPHDDPLLASAYAASRCLALCSWYETPGLVALEAGRQGVPLVLPREGAAPEYFGDLAAYVGSDDPVEIRTAVLNAYPKPRELRLIEHVAKHYSWNVAARATAAVYEMLSR